MRYKNMDEKCRDGGGGGVGGGGGGDMQTLSKQPVYTQNSVM